MFCPLRCVHVPFCLPICWQWEDTEQRGLSSPSALHICLVYKDAICFLLTYLEVHWVLLCTYPGLKLPLSAWGLRQSSPLWILSPCTTAFCFTVMWNFCWLFNMTKKFLCRCTFAGLTHRFVFYTSGVKSYNFTGSQRAKKPAKFSCATLATLLLPINFGGDRNPLPKHLESISPCWEIIHEWKWFKKDDSLARSRPQ